MEKEVLKVEYLVLIDTSNGFCSNLNAFNSLLQSNSELRIEDESILFKRLTVGYNVQILDSKHKDKNFFHITFECNETQEIVIFEDFLRKVRVILHKVGGNQVQKLWDDVSFYYSCKAYPLINELENLMRKLITKFMVTKVGLSWVKHNIPKEVKDSVKNSVSDNSLDFLYNIDFIKLSDFLFKKYSPYSQDELFEKLKKAKEISDIDDLKTYIPKSNWDRYFSELVNFEEPQLNKKWKKLYDFRNKVAHNNFVEKNDFEQISCESKEVKKILQEAIQKLDNVEIPATEKDLVADNAIEVVLSVGTEVFEVMMQRIKHLLAKLINFANRLVDEREEVTDVDGLVEYNIITKQVAQEYKYLSDYYKKYQGDQIDQELAHRASHLSKQLRSAVERNLNKDLY
ncbi:HEPN domain-containing protein [Bacillus spizizenii]|nr:HEPN domain-containing protein [Bacillus spizizenii]